MYTRFSSLVCLLTLLAVAGCDSAATTTPPKKISDAEQKKMMEGMRPQMTPEMLEQMKKSAGPEGTPAAGGEAKPAEEKPAEEKPAEEKPAEEKKADEKPAEEKKE